MQTSNSENYIGGLKNLKQENEKKYLNDCLENAEKIGNLLVKRDSYFDKFIMKKFKKEFESGKDIDQIDFNISAEDIPEYKTELSNLDECFKKYGFSNLKLNERLNKSNIFKISRAHKINYGGMDGSVYTDLPGIHIRF
ncbi:hypothetical protein QLL95_gp0127 [Cotonvirus japonicus]|uniref:Uncharacterized protein n=1 Tax=Cotonvirus japonicus TaxID=2811091 RepID=A0ABM7NR96_9VIRU|nr:hypothetical protein QLL95_gp0127 [Cotonvirus japonicus]BCS82616.1 hypothetical protein [Cotonvirus japonicus]